MSGDGHSGNGTAARQGPADASALPAPTRARFQPLRSGLLNLYLYDEQEFWFEDGRLLLRGSNGTGKSRVLALQLPLLLDGRIEPRRVEPDGDPAKRMEWHLLMDHRHADRVGYSWLELGRLLDSGEPAFITLGMGMSAVQGRGAPRSWFFVTTKRVGPELSLTDRHGAPLLRPALEETIGAEGRVLTTAKSYRDEVNRQLFGLDTTRYEALLDLLIQLRRPQLSRALDEKLLSSALSQALPPLDVSVVRDVAEALGKLERDREELRAARRAASDVAGFASVHDHYLRLEARCRAADLRGTHSSYEETRRKRLQLQREQQEHDAARAAHETERPGLQERIDTLQGELEGLRQSRQMQTAQRLDRMRQELEQRRADLRRLHEEAQDAERALCDRQHEREDAAALHEQQLERLVQRCDAVHGEASAVGLPTDACAQLRALCDAERALRRPRSETARPALETLARQLDTRQQEVRHTMRLQDEARHAEAELQRNQRATDAAQAQADAAADVQRQRAAEREAARDLLLQQYAGWHGALVELRPELPAELTGPIAAFCRDPTLEMPTKVAAGRAHERARAALLEARAALRVEREGVEAERQQAHAEVERLQRGEHTPPQRLPGRQGEAREQREGAPLWKVCDFAADLGPVQRAGLEGALEATGLLDAWIPPEGDVVLDALDDAVLVPAGGQAPTTRPTLADALTVAIDPDDPRAAALDEVRVRQVLDAVGLGPRDAGPFVDPAGGYRLGPLTGRHHKDQAEHIGHGAREQARRAALSRAQAHLDALDDALSALDERGRELQVRLDAAEQERAQVPDGAALRATVHAEAEAQRVAYHHRERLQEATRLLDVARRARAETRRALADAAAALSLSPHLDDLPALLQRVSGLEHALRGVRDAVRAEEHASDALDAAERRADEAGALRQRLSEALASQQRDVGRRTAELDALQAAAGAEVAAVLAQIAAAEAKVRDARRALDILERSIREREHALIRIEAQLETLEPVLREHQAQRDRAAAHLQNLCGAGLLAHLAGDFESWADAAQWSATRSVEVARRIERALSEVTMDPRARERARNAVQTAITELRASLGAHQLDPRLEERQGVFVVVTPLRGKDHSPGELEAHFEHEAEARARVLQEEERRVIENHVIDQLAVHMQQRLRGAAETAQQMGKELKERPLHTGMRIDLQWEPDPELGEGLHRVRKLMDSAGSVWSLQQRAEVADFLRHRIDEAREAVEHGAEEDALQRALDYRKWHRFAIYREQDGVRKRLTKRTHGTGSGGEKAIALTLPQLAAAAAHYSSAVSHAPRIILMDEAFVGVDSDMRKKCMGLLAAFDLDMVLTSEREWGCYPTVPALAIYQLVTQPGVDAIHATRWVWNGRERVQTESPRGPSEADAQAPLPGLEA